MSKFDSLLMGRFKAQKKEKMNELVERSTSGTLSSFGGVFQVSPMNQTETASLNALLKKYQKDETNLLEDLKKLETLTSEVKAISTQAIILHGQRIKQAQTLLKKYQDGAFSAWLIQTYGNRQTPYNFLQYYELYLALPSQTRLIIAEMPRQAIYSLSTRSISQEEKVAFIENYKGETKTELLQKLRTSFPLPQKDKRKGNQLKIFTDLLKRALELIQSDTFHPTPTQRKEIQNLLDHMQQSLQ